MGPQRTVGEWAPTKVVLLVRGFNSVANMLYSAMLVWTPLSLYQSSLRPYAPWLQSTESFLPKAAMLGVWPVAKFGCPEPCGSGA